MDKIKINGTELYVNAKHEDLYELSLVLSKKVIYTFGLNQDEYNKMIDYLNQTDFSQNCDYPLYLEKDPKNPSSFCITRWETDGAPKYCLRAWINNDWSQYNLIEEKDLKKLPQNLENIIIKKEKEPEKADASPLPFAATVPKTETSLYPANLKALKNELLDFVKKEKQIMKKGQ